MPVAQHDILRYLPHRPPFVMIDEIVVEEGRPARSTFRILADNVLLKDGYFTEAGLVENIAQTAGAATGLTAQLSGNAPSLGYIGALRDLRVFALPQVDQTLQTEVTFVQQVMNALIVRGEVTCEGKLLVTCELKIFLQT